MRVCCCFVSHSKQEPRNVYISNKRRWSWHLFFPFPLFFNFSIFVHIVFFCRPLICYVLAFPHIAKQKNTVIGSIQICFNIFTVRFSILQFWTYSDCKVKKNVKISFQSNYQINTSRDRMVESSSSVITLKQMGSMFHPVKDYSTIYKSNHLIYL